LAHQADPSAELLLNEYDIECIGASFAARRRALLTLVRDLLARGVPLHGIGLQGHIQGKYQIDKDGLYNFVSEIESLGLSVHVTELDVIDKDFREPFAVRDAMVAARAYDFLNSVFAAARPSVSPPGASPTATHGCLCGTSARTDSSTAPCPWTSTTGPSRCGS
jgi:endo-1,4-beta-xylanase